MADIGRRERRKGMSPVLLLVAAFWATPTCLAQQAYPPGVYGIWPTVVPNSAGVPNDISSGVHCSGTPEQCSVPTPPTCTPATTHPPYTGQLLLENRPEPLGTGGVVGILLNVPWTSVYTGSGPSQQDWSAMDQLLIEAQACGLSVALQLSMPLDNVPPFAGPPGLPQWVADQITCSPPSCPNGQIQETVILGTPNLPNSASNICPPPQQTPSCMVPVFWDPTFNNDRVGFIQAAAAHIYTSGLLSPAVQQNIVAVLVQPFGAADDDWFIPHSGVDANCHPIQGEVDQVMAWQTAGYSTSTMLAAAQTILNATAAAFPSLNLKLPIQSEGACLDGINPVTGTDVAAGTDVALATQVLSWAYGASSGISGRFFAQLNFVTSNVNGKSPPDCVSPCQLDNPHSPYSVFNLIRKYQPQGVGLQDLTAAVDGAVDSCQQNGGTPQNPGTCTPCDSPPVQYATVSQNTWNVVQTYTPRFWEISRGDATTATGPNNIPPSGCPITSPEQVLMRNVFSAATTELDQSPMCQQNVDSEFYFTRSGYVFNFGTQRFYQTVKLTNTGSAAIPNPLTLVLDKLSGNATLYNASGTTACGSPLGSPFINLSGPLAPGASASVTLQFANPSRAGITYASRVLAGSGAQ
jgi:hypothetical protein